MKKQGYSRTVSCRLVPNLFSFFLSKLVKDLFAPLWMRGDTQDPHPLANIPETGFASTAP